MSQPILVVDDRHDVLELNRILLEAEGYMTTGCSYSEATLDRLHKDHPDVMLLDLVPHNEAPWALLRRLRGDPALREIGVVVTSDSPALVDRALRDTALGVAAGLVMPFDIEALYAAIAAARRGQTSSTGATNPLLAIVAEALRRERARILLRWVQRLSMLETFRRQPDLSLTTLQGQGVALLDSIADALDLQSSADAPIGIALGDRGDAARAHARLRREQGAPLGDLARETGALRREVCRAAHAAIAEEEPAADAIWDLLRRIDVAFDEALYAMLDAWSEGTAP